MQIYTNILYESIEFHSFTLTDPSVEDYKNARYKAMSAGGHGTGRDEFYGVGFVTCVEDRFIVSDTWNHRIKIYDNSLNLVRIFGEYGRQDHQLNGPYGVCTGRDGQLFVSDSRNHRIVVYDQMTTITHSSESLALKDQVTISLMDHEDWL